MALTLNVDGALAWQGILGARTMNRSVMGATVACVGMIREKHQKGRCEEEEEVGTHQCPQDVLAAFLSTGPNTGRVPAGGE